ncbi:5898_t:CDS:2 [Acaulospora colombiana]|uniref:5898_t:CDS:1 n=1 Tax=Acaulospora colombiana TaxID=27376 RepID=A0ACA9MDG5_9GLOM|nr:5898_t:CDS:2 [Acaulospora colombiana]
MNSIIAVDILIDNDGKLVMYGAPNKDSVHIVSGKLRIVLSKPLKTKYVSIKLKGKSEYSDWENQYSCINILKLDQILVERDTLPRGVTDLDYEFAVPGNIPQTYVTSFGLIRYKLVAMVQPASLLAKYSRVERGIHFARHYLPCRRELLPAPPTKVYRGRRKNILKYELDVPTVVCVNEKSFLVRIRLLPLNEQGRVKSITFDLVQSEKYRVQPTPQDLVDFAIDSTQPVGSVQLSGSSSTKRKRTHPIKPTTLNIIYDNDTWNNPLTYNLPFAQYANHGQSQSHRSRLKSTIKSPLMKVRHKLKLTMTFENEFEKKLEIGFPIIVTTIPEVDDQSSRENGPDSAGLPSYDDVMVDDSPTVGYYDSEIHSRPATPDDHSPSIHSDPSSRNQSRAGTRPTTPINIYEDGGSASADNTPGNSFTSSKNNHRPFHTDYFSYNPSTAINNDSDSDSHAITINGNATIRNLSSPDLHQPLRKKKSQRTLAQSLGRFLLRNESLPSLSLNSQSVSASTTPTALAPSQSPPTQTNPSPPSLEITSPKFQSNTDDHMQTSSSSSTSTLRPLRSMTSLTTNNDGTLMSRDRKISNLYATRAGRASWYLNMPDEDDLLRQTPEIRSAPSSPRLAGIEMNFNLVDINDDNSTRENNLMVPEFSSHVIIKS